jgi:hypothetical protein
MTNPFLEPLVTSVATFAAGVAAIANDLPIEPKEVGLLTIVVGIGAWIVKSIDKTTDAVRLMTAAQADTNTKTALLSAEIEESRRDNEQMRAAIVGNLNDLPARIAAALKATP